MTKCFLIGNPVQHSLSPGMHKIIYNELGLNNWEYKKRKISTEDELKNFVLEAVNCNYAGFNITVPYKETIMKYISKIDNLAKSVGACNTVVNKDGRLIGYNTDIFGFEEDIKVSLSFYGGSAALVIGAGGAARAVVGGLIKSVKEIFVFDINKKQTVKLKNDFIDKVIPVEKKDIRMLLSKVDIVVNATPVGMREGDDAVIELKNNVLKKGLSVYDVIYNRRTELIRDASELQIPAVGGIGMFIGQGVLSHKLWSGGMEVPKEVMEKIKKYIIEVIKND